MTPLITPPIIYPDSDGQPMAENTKQFRWIVLFKENLECLFADDLNVFVAGDLLWYPVEGRPDIRVAPDAMVVFGRPKGDRGSYQQWQEENITPQVIFEILSPVNTAAEMNKKLAFYDRYGVEEYYIYDPDENGLTSYQRLNGQLFVVHDLNGWVSPRLRIRFQMQSDTLEIYYPDGRKFLTTLEFNAQAQQAELAAMTAKREAQNAQQQAEKLAAQLRALGVEPNLE
ncbi:Uma2 family endonuclease [Synechococcus sp. PCC 6312]|uniref:Uma2 family endonuclease n=1 Tax=Synechococcus sp. (strain ATCC 27167 / PCC 6312) TaxID=195253 RepID=UPI00029ECD06|nr:Uma2 family endonuclease [Synechococcus sp. PCC 6312]AFY62422.1 hypothetical protein Syn6312_3394 [Synechococcus sp. PCC 6312]